MCVTERKKIQQKLKENDIPSMIYYPRGMHQQQAFKCLKLTDNDYPVTVEMTNRVLSLPMHPYMEKAEIDFVCDIILDNLGE